MIEWAEASDAAALSALHAASFSPGWSTEAIASLLESPGCFALCCRDRAFILLRAVLDEAEIITLATAPAHRRQGLAHSLLLRAVAACAARGVETIHLEVAAGNEPARQLYGRIGFRQVGLRAGYYENGDDAVLLRLNLSATANDPAFG